MADEVERVEYVFEGDVSSLRDASQAAISMLNKYSDTMKRAATTDAFSASQRSTKSMNASIGRLTRDLTKLQSQLKSVGDVKLPTGSDAARSMESTISTLTSQMGQLNSADSITTKTLTQFRTQLEGVRSTLQGATPQMDRLISSEQRFQNVLNTVSGASTRFRDSMTNLQTRLTGVFEPVTNRLKNFGSHFDGISVKMQAFKDKAATAFSRVSRLADACASAFRRTAQSNNDADASANASAKSHRSLGSILSSLTSKFRKETEAITDEKDELDSKDTTLKKTTSAHNKLSQALFQLGRRFKSESASSKKLTSSFSNLSNITRYLRMSLSSLVGMRIGDWLAQATTKAIGFIENLNLFSVAMGESIDKGLQFVDTMQEVYGMDPSNLYQYAGYFYQLTDALGMSSKASASLSLSLTKASNDIASLFNAPIDQVVENLASGLQGMTRAVRKYGMDIRTVTLQQTALKYGITEQVDSMSEADRQALRYITMIEQVDNALSQTVKTTDGASETMGDFARNIETPANQLRIFKEQMSQLGRAIGNFILVPLSKAIAHVNGFVMALRTALTFIASFFKILSTSVADVDVSNAEDSLSGIGDAAGDAAKKVKDLVAPFDELNILQAQDTSGSSIGSGLDDVLDPRLEQAVVDMELKLENIRMKANEVRDALLEFFGFKIDTGEIISWDSSQFEQNLINKFPQWTQTIQAVFDNWSAIVQGFKAVFASISEVVSNVKTRILEFFGIFVNDDTVSTFIDNLSEKLQGLADWISNHETLLTNMAIAVLGIVTAFKAASVIGGILSGIATVFSTVAKVVSPLITGIKAVGTVLGALSTPALLIIAGIAALIAILIHLWNTSDSFREAVTKGIDSIIKVVSNLWETVLKPIIESIWNNLKSLWERVLKPIIGHVIDIIGNLIELIMALWNNVLAPIINWLINSWGPAIANVFDTVWTAISQVFESIGLVIDGFLTALNGIIEFLVGVFTGDWKRAWHGLVNIFVGIGNALISVFETVVNAIIGLINSLISLVYNAITGLINSILGGINKLASLLGFDIDLHIGGKPPAIPPLNIPRIPEMAKGGVVTSPTYALIGEGKYNEAVIPLGDSPQVDELIQRIADAVDKPDNSGAPVDVHVYIGDKEWDAFTYKSAQRGSKLVGSQPVEVLD